MNKYIYKQRIFQVHEFFIIIILLPIFFSPYDSTRVVLTDCPGGDYINANHVVMTIPGSGIINRYLYRVFHMLGMIFPKHKYCCLLHWLLVYFIHFIHIIFLKGKNLRSVLIFRKKIFFNISRVT